MSFTDVSPPAGTPITVSYVANGWGIGNGVMDEDGRHSNCLGANNDSNDAVELDLCNGGAYATAQVATDLDAVLGQMANNYFSNMNAVFGKYFGNGASRKVLNLGPDPLIYWVSPPAPGVLQAAGKYTDVIEMQSYMGGYTLTQGKLDYIRQYAGDVPLLNVDFITGQPDSALRAYTPSSAWEDLSTQAARGTQWLSLIQGLTSIAYSDGGDHPFVGTAFWQYTDAVGQQLNYGLVTPYDNAYDGNEDVTGTVTCSAPNQAYSCGKEQYTSGDFMTGVKKANALWWLP